MKFVLSSLMVVLATISQAEAGIYDLKSPKNGENCQVVSGKAAEGQGFKIRQCEEPINNAERGFFLVKTQFRDLPRFVQDNFKGIRKDIQTWDEVYLSISTENDDISTLGICKARDTSCTDDVGYTVGSSLTVGGVYKGKYDVQFKVSNALYAQSINGTYTEDPVTNERFDSQNIRSVLMIELLVNSARQNNLFYWSAGTGIIALASDEKFGFFDAAGQQRSLHRLLNSVSQGMAVNRTNIDDGRKDQWGFYLLTGIGVQKIFDHSTDGLRSRSYAQVTTRISTLARHSEARFEGGAALSYPVMGHQGRASIGASIASTAHSAGLLHEGTVFVKYENGKKWEGSVGLTCARGKLANFAAYNIPNIATHRPDCTYSVNLKYYLD